jgi:hypothetical protein
MTLFYKSSGFNPVFFATLANMRGPISSVESHKVVLVYSKSAFLAQHLVVVVALEFVHNGFHGANRISAPAYLGVQGKI